MFRLLGKINIATQLTLLVAAVAGLAIFVVSRVSESRSQELLLERSYASLADECQLRGFALREAVRSLMRHVRDFGDRHQRTLQTGSETSRERILEQLFSVSVDRHDDYDRESIHEVCLVQLTQSQEMKPTGQVRTRNVVRRLGDQRRPTPIVSKSEEPSNAAAADVWERLRRGFTEVGPSREWPARQFLSRLRLARENDVTDTNKPYLLAISYSLPGSVTTGLPILIVTIDFSRLVNNQARRLPRNLLFAVDEEGRWIYHPDKSRIGYSDESWSLPRLATVDEDAADPGSMQTDLRRGVRLEVREVAGLGYYTIRHKLSTQLINNKQATTELERDLLRLSGLRFSHLWGGVSTLVLSSENLTTLQEAHKLVTYQEKRMQSPAGVWPRPIFCERFVGHYINPLYLDADMKVPIGVVLTGAQEEMTSEVHDAIMRLRYRWIIPVLLISAALALTAAYILTRPLRRLTEAAQRLALGDYSVDVQVVAPGEVGDLARAFRDMTARIRSRERELRENFARMNTILVNAADGIITFDQTGRIEQANAAAEEMFGFGPDGLSGAKVQKLMKLPEHLKKPVLSSSLMSSAGTSSLPTQGGVSQWVGAVKTPGEEHRGVRLDGSTFWMEVTFSQVPLEDRRLITGIFRDVTARKLSEERIRKMNDELDARVRLRTAQLEDAKSKLELALQQAETANLAKDRFISVVSHELRTPLTSAKGYTELLLNPRATRLRQNPMPTLQNILTSCKHLETLINDLLDVGRYTAGKPIDLVLSSVDLESFLTGVKEMVSPLIKKNGNVLETKIAPNLGQIQNDETRLRQILLNLLSNAGKFTEKGKIRLLVERRQVEDQEKIIFEVCDTGGGMTPEQIEKLFTPFYRVDNSMTRRQGGTGLGLTITKMLCELMGGSIRVHSVPNEGSTFTVILPTEITPQPRSSGPSDQAEETGTMSAKHRGTVLVIDDDPTIRHMLETYLQQEDYQVLLAATGAEGVKMARERLPMCITLDVMMPNEDGWDILARLKSDPLTRDIPVIMLTILEDRERGFTLGATEYVTKPIDWGRLGSILCRYNPGQAPILIVEDDALQRGYLREELILAGWTVLEASNGVEGLKVCESTTPSLILLDLTMPIMDGFTFLDELRKREGGSEIPVVVLTARELNDEERRRLNRSMAQVLAKEAISKDKLLDRIREQMQAATLSKG